MTSASLTLPIGALIADRYEVIAPLGEGAMGVVHHVLDRELDEEVALKFLRAEFDQSREMLARFRLEVKLARRVTHPNVARTFDLGISAGQRFLTMELVRGAPLSARMRPGARVPIPELLRVAAEIARGLVAAHTVGVVHRDLKPSNVLLSDRRVVITDFGVACLADDVAESSGRGRDAAGTPAYMAPEQAQGTELDGRADVYALGVVLYRGLTGELPFKRGSFTTRAEVPDPRARDASIPEKLAELVLASMAPDRARRLDAGAALRRLDALRGDVVTYEPRGSVSELPPDLARGEDATEHPTATTMVTVPRSVKVAPLASDDADSAALAAGVTAALEEALGVIARLVPSSSGRVSDLRVEGTVRTAAAHVRVHTAILDDASGAPLWSAHFDGDVGSPFLLEDRVAHAVAEAVGAQRERPTAASRGMAPGPARDLYDRATQAYQSISRDRLAAAVTLLEQANALRPDDPWIMSALGAAIVRFQILSDLYARDAIAVAEELSLRALASDSTIGETFLTIGLLRLQAGEMRAAVRGFREAIARSPRSWEAHTFIGRLLVETGRIDEGVRHLDKAIDNDRQNLIAHLERARLHLLTGDGDAALATMDRAAGGVGRTLGLLFCHARMALWTGNEGAVERTRAFIREVESTHGDLRDLVSNVVHALVMSSIGSPIDAPIEDIIAMTTTSPRQVGWCWQLGAELLAAKGETQRALSALEHAAALPLVDVAWLDLCPVFAGLRGEARFARVRAEVAARADIW